VQRSNGRAELRAKYPLEWVRLATDDVYLEPALALAPPPQWSRGSPPRSEGSGRARDRNPERRGAPDRLPSRATIGRTRLGDRNQAL